MVMFRRIQRNEHKAVGLPGGQVASEDNEPD